MEEAEKKAKIKWLRRYHESLIQEKRLRDTIRTTRARAESTTQALNGMPHSGGGESKVESGALLLVRYQQDLDAQLRKSEQIRQEIESAINLLPGLQRDVMLARYVDWLPWFKVANRLYISERHARRLHRRGLEAIKCPSMSAFVC